MQGLADGYFVLPYTIQNYLSDQITVPRFTTDRPEFDEAEKHCQEEMDRLMNIHGKRSVDSIHKELGHIMWEYVGATARVWSTRSRSSSASAMSSTPICSFLAIRRA